MDDRTNEILERIIRQKQRLLELRAKQDELTAELRKLEKDYDAGHVTQEELDSQLEVLVGVQTSIELSYS